MYEDNIDYANMRLAKTIVQHKDKLYYVDCVNHDASCDGRYLNDPKQKGVRVMLKDLNLEPLKLGFVNYGKHATYVCRLPRRRDWRQGTRTNNIISYGPYDVKKLPMRMLEQPHSNNYPSVNEVLHAVKNGVNSQAWCRDFCVDAANNLYYNKSIVGGVVDNIPELNEEYSHLKEALEDSML